MRLVVPFGRRHVGAVMTGDVCQALFPLHRGLRLQQSGVPPERSPLPRLACLCETESNVVRNVVSNSNIRYTAGRLCETKEGRCTEKTSVVTTSNVKRKCDDNTESGAESSVQRKGGRLVQRGLTSQRFGN